MNGHALAGADHKVLISIVIKVREEGNSGLVQPVESGICGDLLQAPIELREEKHIWKITKLRQVDVIDTVPVCVPQSQANQPSPVLIQSPDGEFVCTPMDQTAARQALDQLFSSISKEGLALSC